ncbi:Uncharacterized protein dnm_094350 [Desulfonema magnum]|uniref:Uncharacterized protein n=1 Tax=Desulfonema magnum TaxID=45655 RepID=A0A975BGE0_9BACT|nr:Uncharacterized protein dnm_012540 [Desulfonema magnum]QTA87720.1 Uncharacterized protein dnm_037550 [Desulfonema magnum]QTA88269.1 Uncharacterized protein dnm_043110 [Desulfonema magnum]QTA89026.1 Uncharacterized protein dnm_050730 [Desulfonema magnum]QTA89682.1 Uncharacterized protein dnm_057390 [Desulfonema magnum]
MKLFIVAHISFRAVPRVLRVLADYLGITKVPCVQTIINWVTRLSVARLRNAVPLRGAEINSNPFSNGFVYIIDISIALGKGKILTLLSLNANHHDLNETAPTLKDVNCVAVSVAVSWTGEAIADFLKKVIGIGGMPVAYLKDGGTDLAKATRLLAEQGLPSVSIDDISHTVANLLKHEYQNHPMFDIFISAVGKVSKKFKQTVLACLAPPKVSTKSRFMNLRRLVNWAAQLLRHSPRGRAPKGSVLSKLRAGIDQIPRCRNFIECFLRDSGTLSECQKILKTKGLNLETYEESKKLLEAIPPRSSVRTGFTNWLDKHIIIAKELKLENIGMPITSDNIESLFAVSKQHGTGEIKDANRIALRMPAMCGELTREDARRVMNISLREQQEFSESLFSLTKQRRKILANPGSLEILSDKTAENSEFIPESEKRAKKIININISSNCKKITGPLTELENRAESLPEIKISEAACG